MMSDPQKVSPLISSSMNSKYWTKNPNELWQELQSSPQGLSASEVNGRLEKYGPNVLSAKRELTPLGLFLNQFKSPIVLILIFATLMSAFLQDWTDAIIILFIVLGSAILSFLQENNAHNAADKLRGQVTLKAKVLRDGQSQSIPAEEVVPGDVVLLSAGSLIPADGVVLEAKDFFVNQAVLTGETFPAEKKPGPAAARAGLTARRQKGFL